MQLNSAKKKNEQLRLNNNVSSKRYNLQPSERILKSACRLSSLRRLGNDVDSPLTARSGGDGGTGVAALY